LQPEHPAAGTYRRVARTLHAALQEEGVQSLAVMPVDLPAGGLAAVHLTVALAERCRRAVLLLDAGGTLADLLGVAGAPGWAELLFGLDPQQARQETGWPGLHMVAGGNPLAGLTSPLLAQRMRHLLDGWKPNYELTLAHAPAPQEGRSVGPLPFLCDAVCVLPTYAAHVQGRAARLVQQLQDEGARVLGSVVIPDEPG
jgi:hypothetical protein